MAFTILLADDSAMARMFIKRCFEIAGAWDAEFLEAKDGEEALELTGTNDVDLVVTDLNMPVMDGTAYVRTIYENPDIYQGPIVVVTSLQNEAKEAELLGYGVHSVLSKPISPAAMAELLETIPGWTPPDDEESDLL
jgi:two-component system chemotaxis response regulator CheY